MNRRALLLLSLLLAAGIGVVVARVYDRGYDESDTRTLRETIPFDSKRTLVVDNLFGPIRVTGTSGSAIRMIATERVSANTRDRIERARREVALVVHQTADGVVICADGPFRDPDDCTEWRQHERWDPGYEVSYAIELEVPRDVELDLHTIEGDITVHDVEGDFDIKGVNGRVEMRGVHGSGRAATVNGPVRVSFVGNPSGDTDFKTVDGEIEVTFQSGLAAAMTFKTMNGDVLTDFDYELLPPRSVRHESHDGGTKFRLESTSAVRVAGGGPRFHFENINGDILIRRDR